MSPCNSMPVFYSLKDITHIQPWQVGEMARLLHQLQQTGQTIPESWIIPAECFQQALQKLVAREPVLADWPQLLWQAPSVTGYAGQNFAQRLRRPILGLPLNWPLEPLLAALKTPVVRLLPSLWFGETGASAEFVEMIAAQMCWADVGAVETAIKQLWAEMVSARSLAYWQHWQRDVAGRSRPYPQDIGIAIIIQAVEPVQLSGTLTVRSDSIAIQAVEGLPKAISEAFPDSYHGHLPTTHPFTWQQGYQEHSYQPTGNSLPNSLLEDCLTATLTPTTAREIVSTDAEKALLKLAKHLQTWASKPLKVEWLWPLASTPSLHLAQALGWPLEPTASQPLATAHHPSHELLGYPASPGQVVGLALVIKPGDPLPASANQHIIVAAEVEPDWLPLLKTATAVVSEKGGLTCHAAILARELQLPAVVGLADATHRLQTGDVLRLDGDRGLIEPLQTQPATIPLSSPLPQVSEIDCRTEIWLNLSQPELAAAMASLPVMGVGLLRSEWLMLTVLDRQHPYQWLDSDKQRETLLERLAAQLRPIAEAFFPRPVRYRSLDIRSNEFAQLNGAPPVESNPMLGVRGTFSYQQHPEFFQLELAVLKRLQSEGYTNLQLLLPFVRTVEEVQYCQQLIQAGGVDQSPGFELWMMAEVPSVLFLMPQYVAAGIQGIAIGTNDLTQLVLGVDRNQALLSARFDAHHPAMQAAIAQLIHQAQTLEIPCILCGVAPAHYADFVTFLVQQGVTGISLDAAAMEATIRATQQAEASY